MHVHDLWAYQTLLQDAYKATDLHGQLQHSAHNTYPLQAGSNPPLEEGRWRIAMVYSQAVGQDVIDGHAKDLTQRCGPHGVEAIHPLPGGGMRMVLKFANSSGAAAALRQGIAPVRGCLPTLMPWSRRASAQPTLEPNSEL